MQSICKWNYRWNVHVQWQSVDERANRNRNENSCEINVIRDKLNRTDKVDRNGKWLLYLNWIVNIEKKASICRDHHVNRMVIRSHHIPIYRWRQWQYGAQRRKCYRSTRSIVSLPIVSRTTERIHNDGRIRCGTISVSTTVSSKCHGVQIGRVKVPTGRCIRKHSICSRMAVCCDDESASNYTNPRRIYWTRNWPR